MQNTPFFHHPDFCPTLVRRRATEALIDCLQFYGELLLTRGRSLTWSHCFPSRTAYYAAVGRLKHLGVVNLRIHKDGRRTLRLDKRAISNRPLLNPEQSWNARWDGIWRLLVYDIPEPDKSFRNSLVLLLRRMKMGCLQRSVWVSPRDIRPEYDDLIKTSQFHFDSYLFEARTVLGRKSAEVVRDAWDMRKLHSQHQWFIKTCDALAARIEKDNLAHAEFTRAAGEEALAYRELMNADPLLPHSLLPSDYLGVEAYARHKAFVALIHSKLR
jgi:DNA-binding transcriptional regulator PaaX